MTAMTIQDVSRFTERESAYWYLVGLIRSLKQSATAVVLIIPAVIALIPLLAIALIFAQIYPYSLRKIISCLKREVPDIQDKKELKLLRDTLKLAYSAGGFYKRVTLFRSVMSDVLDELDELIDSLEFVISDYQELNEFLTNSEKLNSPELPLTHAKA